MTFPIALQFEIPTPFPNLLRHAKGNILELNFALQTPRVPLKCPLRIPQNDLHQTILVIPCLFT